MGLDVYLIGKEKEVECTCSCGHKHTKTETEEFYWSGITHNLNQMASEAGIYECLWRPDEHDFKKAKDIIEPLESGLKKLKANPKHFKKFDSPNGWGKYTDFVPWVEQYLNACKEFPEAEISVSR
jgi:hypothetical protein